MNSIDVKLRQFERAQNSLQYKLLRRRLGFSEVLPTESSPKIFNTTELLHIDYHYDFTFITTSTPGRGKSDGFGYGFGEADSRGQEWGSFYTEKYDYMGGCTECEGLFGSENGGGSGWGYGTGCGESDGTHSELTGV